MKIKDSNIQNSLDNANYQPILEWLKTNIHQHGRRYSRNELLELSTGRSLDSKPYLSYLKEKASDVYGLNF
jgi:carboxypeptidase Taq